MPASRSPPRAADPAPRSRPYLPLVLIGLVAVLGVIIAALPASIITRFLPPSIHAEDFSGSVWHGSAGKFSVAARDAGALEWHLHPASLLALAVAADVHWVKIGFVLDAVLRVNSHGYTAQHVVGGGPLEDLREFGVPPGWRGTATINVEELTGDFTRPTALSGDMTVSDVSAAQFADGADLGGYAVHLDPKSVDAEGNVAAQIKDTGGPIELQANVRVSTKEHQALLTGTVKERAETPPALAQQINNLSQLRPRDPQGRIPIDFEFSF